MANIVTSQQASIPIKSNKLFVGATYYYLFYYGYSYKSGSK